MGKTTTTYCAFEILRQKAFVKRALVIAPRRVCWNVWPKQCKDWLEFEHLRVGVLHGPKKDATLEAVADYDMMVINPEGLTWLLKATKDAKGNLKADPGRLRWLAEHFQMLVVDESTKFKDSQTQRFKLLKQLIPKFKRRYILTGTPTPQGLLDLFGQMYILDEGASLGRYITHYRNEYFFPSGYGGYSFELQPGGAERILEKIGPLCLRMEAGDYLKLPKLINNDIYVDLDKTARGLYKKMEDEMIAELELGTVVAANAAVVSGKCRQIAQGGLYTGMTADHWEPVHVEKLDALRDLLEQLQGQPILIAYQYQFDREVIHKELGIPYFGVSDKKDSQLIEQFRQGKLPAVMGHPESISLGLDGLQESCRLICWYGMPWNLLHYTQTIDRVKRQGSTAETVINYRILARDTVDERVLDVLDGKDQDQAAFLRALKRPA